MAVRPQHKLPKTGNFYWKLNTSILEIEDIEDLFKTEWDRIKTSIKKYDNINAWWVRYAKKRSKKLLH